MHLWIFSQQSILLTTHLIQWAYQNEPPPIWLLLSLFGLFNWGGRLDFWFARNQYGTVCRYGLRREVLGVQHLRSTLDPPNVGRLLPRGPGIYCNTWVTRNPGNDHLYQHNTPNNQPSIHPTLTFNRCRTPMAQAPPSCPILLYTLLLMGNCSLGPMNRSKYAGQANVPHQLKIR